MTAIDIDAVADAVQEPSGPRAKRPKITAFALGLWVVVGALLAYGVTQTAIKAAALFG